MTCDGVLTPPEMGSPNLKNFLTPSILQLCNLSSIEDRKHEHAKVMYTLLIQYNYYLNKINLNMDLNTQIE